LHNGHASDFKIASAPPNGFSFISSTEFNCEGRNRTLCSFPKGQCVTEWHFSSSFVSSVFIQWVR
jgi:hypothetical protein